MTYGGRDDEKYRDALSGRMTWAGRVTTNNLVIRKPLSLVIRNPLSLVIRKPLSFVIPEGAKRLSGIFPNIEGSLIRSRLKAGMTYGGRDALSGRYDVWRPGDNA